jgi:hypothetical protein
MRCRNLHGGQCEAPETTLVLDCKGVPKCFGKELSVYPTIIAKYICWDDLVFHAHHSYMCWENEPVCVAWSRPSSFTGTVTGRKATKTLSFPATAPWPSSDRRPGRGTSNQKRRRRRRRRRHNNKSDSCRIRLPLPTPLFFGTLAFHHVALYRQQVIENKEDEKIVCTVSLVFA